VPSLGTIDSMHPAGRPLNILLRALPEIGAAGDKASSREFNSSKKARATEET
jgi:hypothetical protein